MDHSAPQTTNPREPKRVPMACTICRQKKLKCRPLPASSDSQKRCQRCAEGNLQCIFVPVNSGQPVPTSSMQQQFQFRVDPSPYDPAYSNFTWEEQQDVVLNDPASGMIDARGPGQRTPSMQQEYANSPFHSSSGHSPQYHFPSGWQPGYPGQPQGAMPPPGDVNSPNADPMQYHMHNGGPTWSGNPTQHQYYPPYDMNRSYPDHFEGGKSEGSAWK